MPPDRLLAFIYRVHSWTYFIASAHNCRISSYIPVLSGLLRIFQQRHVRFCRYRQYMWQDMCIGNARDIFVSSIISFWRAFGDILCL